MIYIYRKGDNGGRPDPNFETKAKELIIIQNLISHQKKFLSSIRAKGS